jgi:hypothetical protein
MIRKDTTLQFHVLSLDRDRFAPPLSTATDDRRHQTRADVLLRDFIPPILSQLPMARFQVSFGVV